MYTWTIDKARRLAASARVWRRMAAQLEGNKREIALRHADADRMRAIRLGREAARIRSVVMA